MKERPILFSVPMVRAILRGSKTQTRRIVKPQPKFPHLVNDECCTLVDRCPFGKVGDHLWVKETWAPNPEYPDPSEPPIVFKADFPAGSPDGTHDTLEPWGTWKPSLFMSRAISRLTLEITEVRVQRLHDLTEGEANAEGCYSYLSSISIYAGLWDHLNGKRGYPWESNPFVWAISFKPIGLTAAGADQVVRMLGEA